MKIKKSTSTVIAPDDIEVVKGTIPASEMGAIVRTYVNRYNYPHMASLREIVTNAYDSHMVAGQTRPVEVTIPTALNPTLIVRDFGVGMSADTVRNIFANMRVSTKRDNDNEHGGFGIGSKSPLAYANQFIVTSVHEGLRCVFCVGLVDDTLTTYFMSKDEPTDEPNGVTVTVPMDNIGVSYFTKENVNDVLKGFTHDEVKVVNLPEEGRFCDGWVKMKNGYVSFSFKGSGGSHYNQSGTAIVGKVHYNSNSNIRTRVDRGCTKSAGWRNPFYGVSYALNLDVKDVTVSESREVIEDTSENNDVICRKAEALEKEVEEFRNRVMMDSDMSDEGLKDLLPIERLSVLGTINATSYFNCLSSGGVTTVSYGNPVKVSSSSLNKYVVLTGDIDYNEILKTVRAIRRHKIYSIDGNKDHDLFISKMYPGNSRTYFVHTDSQILYDAAEVKMDQKGWEEFKKSYDSYRADLRKKKMEEKKSNNPSSNTNNSPRSPRRHIDDLEIRYINEEKKCFIRDVKDYENVVILYNASDIPPWSINSNTNREINVFSLNKTVSNSKKRMEEIKSTFSNLIEIIDASSDYNATMLKLVKHRNNAIINNVEENFDSIVDSMIGLTVIRAFVRSRTIGYNNFYNVFSGCSKHNGMLTDDNFKNMCSDAFGYIDKAFDATGVIEDLIKNGTLIGCLNLDYATSAMKEKIYSMIEDDVRLLIKKSKESVAVGLKEWIDSMKNEIKKIENEINTSNEESDNDSKLAA